MWAPYFMYFNTTCVLSTIIHVEYDTACIFRKVHVCAVLGLLVELCKSKTRKVW